MNLWEEKLNIGRAIYDIGSGNNVTLHFNKDGYMITSDVSNYYPDNQGEIQLSTNTLSASVQVKDDGSGGDWAKWYAETLIGKIEEQMKEKEEA